MPNTMPKDPNWKRAVLKKHEMSMWAAMNPRKRPSQQRFKTARQARSRALLVFPGNLA